MYDAASPAGKEVMQREFSLEGEFARNVPEDIKARWLGHIENS